MTTKCKTWNLLYVIIDNSYKPGRLAYTSLSEAEAYVAKHRGTSFLIERNLPAPTSSIGGLT